MSDNVNLLDAQTYIENNFLEHAGVKGMKWGVRKREYKPFQNIKDAVKNRRTVAQAKADGTETTRKDRIKRNAKTTALTIGVVYLASPRSRGPMMKTAKFAAQNTGRGLQITGKVLSQANKARVRFL